MFSYAGKPFKTLHDGTWLDAWGWQELKRVANEGLGTRWAAGLRRAGLPLPIERWAGPLDRVASWLDAFGSERGGMLVSVMGTDPSGRSERVEWHLLADHNHGPEIPCIAAILLARKIARNELPERGAYPCMGFLELKDFEPEFARWGITTMVEEYEA